MGGYKETVSIDLLKSAIVDQKEPPYSPVKRGRGVTKNTIADGIIFCFFFLNFFFLYPTCVSREALRRSYFVTYDVTMPCGVCRSLTIWSNKTSQQATGYLRCLRSL